jgi:hypothetical protein
VTGEKAIKLASFGFVHKLTREKPQDITKCDNLLSF